MHSVMGSPTLRIPIRQLLSTGDAALRSLNFEAADRQTILDVLLYAQLRGNSQNFIKLCSGGVPRHQGSHPELISDTGVTFALNAKGAFGMVAMRKATDTAISNARRHGVCVGGVHGVASSTGAIGYWAREIARAGLVGVVCSQSPELVAPHGSSQALLGTNPIAFGFPRTLADGRASAVVVDVATSAVAFYDVVARRATGARLPEGVAVDAAGRGTTDPSDVAPPERGALLPFGGPLGAHKGSALAVAVELLGVLAGGAGAGKWGAANWGNLFIAVDPARLLAGSADPREFAARVDEVAVRIEGAPPVGGSGGRVLLPGQRGDEEEAACLREGCAPVTAALWDALQRQAGGPGEGARL